jgi:hypothetical protein
MVKQQSASKCPDLVIRMRSNPKDSQHAFKVNADAPGDQGLCTEIGQGQKWVLRRIKADISALRKEDILILRPKNIIFCSIAPVLRLPLSLCPEG